MAKNPENNEDREFRFNLGEAYKFDRFPMKRLTEYLKEISEVIGDTEHAYFVRLEKGSTVVVVRTEPDEVPLLWNNLQAVERGQAPPSQIAAFRRLYNLRDEDHAIRDVPLPENGKVIQFPVKAATDETFELLEPDFGWVEQFESVQGFPVQVGDERERRKVILKTRDGRIHKFETTDEIANRIGAHIFSVPKVYFRAEGTAQWRRMPTGEWKQKNFRVSSISELPNRSLSEDLDALREYPAKWKERSDPLKDLDIIRHEDDIQ